ncbi:MAG: DinB family protein [Vicinamibacterales bacterium]
MPIKDTLLPEFDHEMATTRRVLERVPEAELAWKPHEKSMSMGQLAGHIANMPFWCAMALERTMVELETLGDAVRLSQPVSKEAMLADFAARRATARGLLAAQTDAELLTPWTLKKGGEEIFTLPRISAIRSFVMNHMIHHRGQLTVYLRLKDIPLPPIYGPTADEQ